MKKIGRQFGTSLLAYDGGYPGIGVALPKPANGSDVSVAEKVLGVSLFPELHPVTGGKSAPLDPINFGAK
jgi:hypothetical protein